MSVCLDAFAILVWLQNESGADEVEEFLVRATEERDFLCYLSTINLGEIFYRLIRVKGLEDAETFWHDVRTGAIPVQLIEATRNRIREAARIKATYPVAHADAFAAQAAREAGVPLVTGDPELKKLEYEGVISLKWIGAS